MTSLIIGYGEIGRGLDEVLSQYNPWHLDRDGEMKSSFDYLLELVNRSNVQPKEFDILHICFGYSDEFINQVKRYQEIYKPKFTVIHSTVPVGTTSKLGAIHSPCICQHPFIAEGLKTFPKMLGGGQASEVADYFRRAGLKVVLFDLPETTEAAKLFLTEYYRECINFAKRVKAYSEKYSLNFHEIYTIPNQIYNEGYKKLGFEEFVRPILQPIKTPIGGHCVSQNEKLIKLSE